MKKYLIVLVLLVVAGCSLQQATPENPLGFDDPNVAAQWFQAGIQAGTTGQAVGLATANPALIAGSTLAIAIISVLGANYIRKEK